MRSYLTFVVLAAAAVVAAAGATRVAAGEDHAGHSHVSGPAVLTVAWSPAAPPGINIRAAYFTIENIACAPLTLIGADSPDFAEVMIHRTSTQDGLSSMAPVDQLTLETGQKAVFAPHGLHLMLKGPVRDHKEGDGFPLRLHFDDGTSLAFEVTVGKVTGDDIGDHDHHHSAAKPES